MLAFASVSKRFAGAQAVADVTLEVPRGQFVALVGASGSGKSTLLRTVNRLVEPDTGVVTVGGSDVRSQDRVSLRRGIGFVFQSVGLFPHMDVAANIAIGPRLAGTALGPSRIAALLSLVGLDPDIACRLPHELSGGQRQRVGVARALAVEPPLLLMDEPFGALDPVTRDALGKEVRALHDRLSLTTVMVTHDMAEALLLADRVLVMASGRIVADESPGSLMHGGGGEAAQALVAVPRAQAEALEAMRR